MCLMFKDTAMSVSVGRMDVGQDFFAKSRGALRCYRSTRFGACIVKLISAVIYGFHKKLELVLDLKH
jgi:hypothetical protein